MNFLVYILYLASTLSSLARALYLIPYPRPHLVQQHRLTESERKNLTRQGRLKKWEKNRPI